MNESRLWYDRDDVWADIEPAIFSSISISRAAEHIDNIVKLFNLNQDMQILDLCCGVGRHTMELARRGFNVVAVDRNEIFLQKAKDKAVKENLNIEFIREDMRRFRRPDKFDVVININTSFGYFEDPEDDKVVVRNIYDSLKGGGQFLIEMSSKEIIAGMFRERDWDEYDDMILLQERKVEDNWSSMFMRWIIIKAGQIKEVKMTVRLFSASEMRDLLIGCGFGKVDVYGSLEGIPYDQNAKRMVVVARK
ncbi:MAG: methyltransferase type 11 [candidate division Zixibacteria bacterium HGW-Zixibacteria-1]|nr:MAG: methyltransferase type 11 [candidate division Zixibacteria bacterium HGW-Zixibacteria-1]